MMTHEITDFSTRLAVFSKPDDLHALAKVLAEECGLHPTDAMHEAHSAPCVFTPRLTAANAEQVALAIERLGLHAEPVALDELRAFEDLRTVHHVACRRTGLEILDLRGCPAELIPWEDVEVLSVGETPAAPAHHELTSDFTVVSSGPRRSDVAVDVPTRTMELWIVCRNPERVYRLDASRHNFESLGERRTNSMRLNLRTLLEQMLKHTPQAHLTPAVREFLDNDRLQHFDSAEQLLNATELHLLVAHRLAAESPS